MGKQLPTPMVLDTKDEWFEAADAAIVDLVNRGRPFTADDLRELVPAPGHPNWVGSAFQHAAGAGLIRQTGFEQSRTKSRNGGVLRRWAPQGDPSEPS